MFKVIIDENKTMIQGNITEMLAGLVYIDKLSTIGYGRVMSLSTNEVLG